MNVRTTSAKAPTSGPVYRLQLVFDAGPTMTMWRPLLRSLRQSLAQDGPFQSVTVSVLKADGTLRGRLVEGDRTVTLVLSDCSGPQWYPGPAAKRWYGTLRSWARVRPVAVVQPLPEHMWQRTALPGAPGRIWTPAAGAANTALSFTPYDGVPESEADSVLIPVLEASAVWLENWLALISGAEGAEISGVVTHVPPAVLPVEASVAPVELTAEELVLRFRSTASPEAFGLAGHLAVGVPHLPVMQLVQKSLGTAPSHLAEVILSGMLRAVPGSPGIYAFREGVAALLLCTVPRTSFSRTVALLTRAGADLAGAPKGRVFVSEEGLRRLG
ncbi:SAV_2336 N-terminal domain-related protein [Streptomyces reticuliscabiei]|uniref:SAV_2336 N-terminal domain-related protein n=1 Tax=Streptomyces reticuliscabiei TaxID=146821 RepID=UPI000A383A64|nr:SAV_2336 N-terminal domain-related protein [Streptomyces reticuliscabiei]